MKFTSAAKVGLTAVILLLALAAVYRGLGWNFFPSSGADTYKIYVSFETVKGLPLGAEVQLNGNTIGEVDEIKNDTFGGVLVTLTIESQRAIHEHANFIISRDSIFGGYLVLVEEPRSGSMTSEVIDNRVKIKVGTGQVQEGGPVLLYDKQIGTIISVTPVGDKHSDHALLQIDQGVDLNDTMAFVPMVISPGQPTGFVVSPKIADGATVFGRREAGPEDLVANADAALQEITSQASLIMVQLADLLERVSLALEPEEIRNALDTLTTEASLIANNIVILTNKLNGLLDDAQPLLVATAENIEGMTSEADTLLHGLNRYNDPTIRKDIIDTINNLADASEMLVLILDDIEQYTSDEQMRDDIKASIHEARSAIEEAKNTLGIAQDAIGNVSTGMNIFGGIETSAEFTLRQAPDEDRWLGDLNGRVGLEGGDTFLQAGVDDIGEEDSVNAQVGWWIDTDTSARVGIRRGKLGIGADWRNDTFSIESDLYDLNDLKWSVYGGYAVIPELDIIVGVEDLLDDEEMNFGLAFRF